eukprot:1319323-Amphidinium_carterae.1
MAEVNACVTWAGRARITSLGGVPGASDHPEARRISKNRTDQKVIDRIKIGGVLEKLFEKL